MATCISWGHDLKISSLVPQVLSQDIDLLHPPVELEKAKNKRKRLVQSPNSFFMDVKCQGCFQMCAFYLTFGKILLACRMPPLCLTVESCNSGACRCARLSVGG